MVNSAACVVYYNMNNIFAVSFLGHSFLSLFPFILWHLCRIQTLKKTSLLFICDEFDLI